MKSQFFVIVIWIFIVNVTRGGIYASDADVISCPGKLRSVALPTPRKTPLETDAAWMRDPYQVSERVFYMSYRKFHSGLLYEYESVEDIFGGKPINFYTMPEQVDGTGFVVYDRSMFFTPTGSNEVVRYDLSTLLIEARVSLPEANYDNTSPYGVGLSTDIDLAVDENGLWAIYATEYNAGNIVISRLKHHNLEIVKTWTTDYDKLSALNTFMVCGVLYMVNYKTLKIDHMFNTTSNIGTDVDIRIPHLRNTTSAIKYNPKEQKLYAWDTKIAITYPLNFTPLVAPSVSTTTSAPSPSATRSTTTTRRPRTTTSHKVTTPTPPVIIPPRKRCPDVESGGIMWPATEYGMVVKVQCPEPSLGNAFWICGNNATHPKWEGAAPNFGQCVSEWIQDVQKQLDDDIGSAADLSASYHRALQNSIDIGQRMSVWDIVKSVELQKRILTKAYDDRANAANVMGSMLKSVSLLLSDNLEDSWRGLDHTTQNNVSSELIRVLEDAAFFLAYDMSIPAANNRVNWSETMVSLGIRVFPVTRHSKNAYHDSVLWYPGQGDAVTLDTNALFATADDYASEDTPISAANQTVTKHLAVVLLSFRNMGKYLRDMNLRETEPVDSAVLSVTPAFITRTTTRERASRSDPGELVIVNRFPMDLDDKPLLRMVFRHANPGKEYHVCAYWDDKNRDVTPRWWRSGCKAIETNFTHTTCQCSHMTPFAVLSSDSSFSAMGSDTRPSGPSGISNNDKERDLPILRAGLCISLLFLLLVAVTLLPLSATKRLQSDINTIHKNLVISLIATEVVFLIGIDQNVVPVVCGVVAGLLHLGLLATFTWAAIEAFHLMAILGDVTDRRDRWRWYYIVGYGAPIIVVAASAAADHTGYGTGVVCWLKTDGSFIWSFIGPCCFAILCCIAFLSVTMYRLHLYYSDSPKQKSVRSGVTRSCVLMFLLCALWSCGVLWLSNFQPRATAVFFCILSSLYGMAAFFLHCILPSEVRKHYSSCFSRVAKRTRRRSDPFSSHRQFTTNSSRHATGIGHNGTGRHDLTGSYGGFYTPGTGCTTTLLPISSAQSAALNVNQGRCVSDMDITRITHIDNSHFATQRDRHSDGSAIELARDLDHRDQLLHHTHPGHGDAVRWPEHRYEQPLPQIPHCSTIASTASGHYNHLHEHYPSGSHHHLVPPGGCSHQRNNHHYETMDLPLCKECPAEMGVQLRMDENGRPEAVHYRQCADDGHHRRTVLTAPIRRNRASFPCCQVACEHQPATMHHGVDPGQVSRQDCSTAVNRGYLTHTSQNLDAVRHGYRPDCGQRRPKQGRSNRAGRSSDPLSTDQGYDTDTQTRPCCDSQSDNDHSCSPRPGSSSKPVLPTITAASDPDRQRNSIVAPIPIKGVPATSRRSVSEESLCSENDKEVQMIINADPRSGRRDFDEMNHNNIPNAKVHRGQHDMIDTACGGRLSIAESVTSWCAHAGSNPRAVNASYGKHNKGKSKSTADPEVILANAKMRDTGDTPPQQARSKTYVYTLPGTAAAGTKAKIDLKNGGISMITNL